MSSDFFVTYLPDRSDSARELGKVAPYGVYDLAANPRWMSVGVTNDLSRVCRRIDSTRGRQEPVVDILGSTKA
jgi:hypothetical protein